MAGRCRRPASTGATLVANKDREIARLEGLYQKNVEGAGGEIFHSRADAGRRRIRSVLEGENRTVTADQILIATGGRPSAASGASRP